ncbi:MAG: CDP-alcohol phosphatidyltransferase family protein [Deltaproteobacteria bacterium]|nr:CDP-alcohol phosphatidyltransferase family protein [Deltaproteobacteria bacterium]
MIKHILNPPNWFTSASVFSSVYAMSLLVGNEVTPEILIRASILIFFSGVFDLLDGRVARMTNRASEFGVQLDSIADVVSFGVAPALLAWAWSLHHLGMIGAAIMVLHVLAVAFRLARFNVDAAHDNWLLKGHSRGLTSTMGGAMLVTLVWVSNVYLADFFTIRPWMVATFVSFQAVLMLSSVPFRTFRDMRQNNRARAILAVSMAACLVGAIALDPSMLFGVGSALYLTWGLADGLVVGWHARRLSRDEEDGSLCEEELVQEPVSTRR